MNKLIFLILVIFLTGCASNSKKIEGDSDNEKIEVDPDYKKIVELSKSLESQWYLEIKIDDKEKIKIVKVARYINRKKDDMNQVPLKDFETTYLQNKGKCNTGMSYTGSVQCADLQKSFPFYKTSADGGNIAASIIAAPFTLGLSLAQYHSYYSVDHGRFINEFVAAIKNFSLGIDGLFFLDDIHHIEAGIRKEHSFLSTEYSRSGENLNVALALPKQFTSYQELKSYYESLVAGEFPVTVRLAEARAKLPEVRARHVERLKDEAEAKQLARQLEEERERQRRQESRSSIPFKENIGKQVCRAATINYEAPGYGNRVIDSEVNGVVRAYIESVAADKNSIQFRIASFTTEETINYIRGTNLTFKGISVGDVGWDKTEEWSFCNFN